MAKVMVLYGKSGSGKTSQAMYLSKYVWEKWKKKTRLISADGGGWATAQPMIDIGILEPISIVNHPKALSTVRKLAAGEWPKVKKFKHKETGVIREESVMEPTDWATSNVGAYFVEGIASIAALWKNHISKQNNSDKATKVLFSAAAYEEDGEYFSGTDQGHIGLIQNEMYNIIMEMSLLPVELVVWTSLVGLGSDKVTKETMQGPLLLGTARNLEVPQWVGETLCVEKVPAEEGVEVRIYYENHVDANTQVVCLAKPRVSTIEYPRLARAFPGGYFVTELPTPEHPMGRGVDKFLKALDKLGGLGTSKAEEWLKANGTEAKRES